MAFWGPHLFLQLGCFGLDITFFVFVYSKGGLLQALGLLFTSLFSLLQEGETRCKAVVELNINLFFL